MHATTTRDVGHGPLRAGRATFTALLLMALTGCASTSGPGSTGLVTEVSAQSSLEAGDEAARNGDLQRALMHFLRAVSTEESIAGWLRVGAASERLGHTDRALAAHLRLLDLDPEHMDARQGAGLAYLALGDDANASLHLARVIEQDSQRWRVHNALGILADRAGDHARAIEHFQAALELTPASPMLLNNLGYSRFLAGDLDQAARDFYQTTQQYPDYQPAWSNLGMVYAQRGWYRDAVNIFARVVDRAAAHNDVGYIAFSRGDLVEAEGLLTEAVRLSPTYYPAANRNLELVRARLREQRNGANGVPGPFSGAQSRHAEAWAGGR